MNPLPTNPTAAEAIIELGSLKRKQKEVEESIKQLLAFLDGEEAAGRMEALSYEPGVYEAGGVRLTRSTRTTWQYSPAIKTLQQAEQENGMATAKTSEFWLTKLL